MENSLIEIKEDIKKYANVITNLINVDVGIVDKNMKRIFGTGLYNTPKSDRSIGTVYKNTLETKKMNIIKNPRNHELCSKCLDIDNCCEELEIATPIYCNNEIIGVLGLISFDKNQKQIIMERLDSYIRLTKQIAEFIGMKFFEYKEKKLQREREKTLNQILDNLSEGIIVTDCDNKIFIVNKVGKRKLNFTQEMVGKHISLISQNEMILCKEIYKLKIEENEYNVAGKVIPVRLPNDKKGNAFLFENIQRINKNIIDIKMSENTINLDNIVGTSIHTFLLKEKIKKLSDSNSTVLITGESGTGKELVARSLHSEGDRKNHPFVTINCSAIPDSLLESELFGYSKGAFTGANPNGRMGKFELANNGIIFLDEIGDMPLYLQAKILRVIETKKIERIGSNKSIDLDIRIIAATNVDLLKNISEKKFREDLFYRLNVLPIKIAPLRERKEDIIPIIESIFSKHKKNSGKNVSHIDREVLEILKNYSWPGNVRELENTIELMLNICPSNGVISKEIIPNDIKNSIEKTIKNEKNFILPEEEILDEKGIIEEFEDIEKRYIKKGLEVYGNNTEGKKQLSEKMNIGLTTLYRKIKRYGL